MFARLNGFLGTPAPAAAPARASGGNGAARAAPALVDDPPAERTPLPQPVPEARRPTVSPGPRQPPREPPPDPPLMGKSGRKSEPAPPPPDAFDAEPPPPASMDNDPQRIAVAQRVLETAAELESLIKGKQNAEQAAPESTGVTGTPSGERALFLAVDGREVEKIVKERYLIGRGKHCDLVINSGKVSREHAAIVRDGDDFYLQDLDSSNGTWFNKQRIKRRKIEEGDEYFICSDKVKFSYH
ncbi:MAG TPA: FHA domain-containing protein [Myxococcales bacterium]